MSGFPFLFHPLTFCREFVGRRFSSRFGVSLGRPAAIAHAAVNGARLAFRGFQLTSRRTFYHDHLFGSGLTLHPPRSPRVRLGGYVHLAGSSTKPRIRRRQSGRVCLSCPLDQRFFAFTGLDPAALLAAVKTGKSDTEMLPG